MNPLKLKNAARIYRAMNGCEIDQAIVTLCEVENFRNAETFERFLEVNKIRIFEEVVR